jgi:hypothetical protein
MYPFRLYCVVSRSPLEPGRNTPVRILGVRYRGRNEKTDVLQLDGLADFYKRAANECTRIDLCIYCLGIQRVKHAGLGFEAGLDARTILMGTLLAARHLAKKETIGTILNLALIDPIMSGNRSTVQAAQELVVGVTRYAAQTAPLKVRSFAVFPDRRASLSLVSPQFDFRESERFSSSFDPDPFVAGCFAFVVSY